jgi:hypothetical protein
MLSRSYLRLSQPAHEQDQALLAERSAESVRRGPRAQMWLALLTVLLATWSSWGASSWLLEAWRLQ